LVAALVSQGGTTVGLLTWILIGLVAGILAELLVGGPGGFGLEGLVISTLLGIVGAVVGGFISSRLGYGDITGFNLRSVLISMAGAILVVVLWRGLNNSNRRGSAL